MKKKKIICIMLILIFTSGIVIGAIQLYKPVSYTHLDVYKRQV